jgi:hypothetical protein
MNFKELLQKISSNISEQNDDYVEDGLEMVELFDALAEEEEGNDVSLALIDTLELVYNNADSNTKELIEEALFDVFGGDFDEDDIEEEINERKKIKISKIAKLQRKKDYRRNKAKIKKKASRLRKTAKFKRYTKKKKRMAKKGKTSTGKRQVSFI